MSNSIETILRRALLTLDTVTALVGTGTAAKIRADHPDPDDKPPYIIIEVDEDVPANDLDGIGGLLHSDVNLVCRAATSDAAWALSEAVRLNGTDPGTGLAGYTGTVSGDALDCILEQRARASTPRNDGSKKRWYDVNMTITAIHGETT